MPIQIQLRRDTAANWTSANPTLAQGELGFETDTNKYKVGTGTTAWNSLAYNDVPLSTYTAKGDLIVGTGSSTAAKLAVGANGYTLVADSSQTTGLGWNGNTAAARNVLINGNFDIWQRGTSFTGANDTYTADRWGNTPAGTSINMTITQDTSVPNTNSRYSIKVLQATSNATSVTEYALRQRIEQSNLLPLFGKSCVISFWYRSNKTGNHGIRIYAGYNTGGGDQVATFSVSAADTWEFKTVAVTSFSTVSSSTGVAPTAQGALVDIGFRVGGTGAGFTSVSANDYFQLSQVQLELGTSPSPFTRAGGTIQGELAACQRYYQRFAFNLANARTGFMMGASSTTQIYATKSLPVSMRAVSSVDYSTLGLTDGSNATIAVTAVSINSADTSSPNLLFTVASGLTQYRPYEVINNNNTAGYLALVGEL